MILGIILIVIGSSIIIVRKYNEKTKDISKPSPPLPPPAFLDKEIQFPTNPYSDENIMKQHTILLKTYPTLGGIPFEKSCEYLIAKKKIVPDHA